MPENVMAIVLTKSTIARVGGVCTATPLEPNWTGNITLEFANLTRYPFKMYIDEGCAQLVFFKGNRPNITYSDRNNGQGGKYQDQGPEVVFAKV
jgi:dCTP deaminase